MTQRPYVLTGTRITSSGRSYETSRFKQHRISLMPMAQEKRSIWDMFRRKM